MQTLHQMLRRPQTQYCHQTDIVFRLPDKFHRLIFQFLIETMTVQRVFTHPGPHQRHQRQPFTQLQTARQFRVLQYLQRTVDHFGGVAQLQQIAVGVYPGSQRFYLRPVKQQFHLFLRQRKIMLRSNFQFNQADIIMTGNNLRSGTRGQHPLNTG